MERPMMKPTFNAGLSQRPIILEGNEASLPLTTFPPKLNLQDASFSSYLQPKSLAHRVVEDTELNVFQAERYFNDIQNHKDTNKSSPLSVVSLDERIDISSVSSVDGYVRNYKTRSFHATPTASSEASWNSKSGLLSNTSASIVVSMKNLPLDGNENSKGKKKGCSTKWFFGLKCPCPCSGKKSVQVVEESPVPVNSDSKASLNLNKQSSKAPNDEKSKVLEKSLGIDDKSKLELAIGGSAKERERVRGDSGRFSPENHFPAETTRGGGRGVPLGSSLDEGNGFTFPILNPSVAVGKLLLKNVEPMNELEDPPRDSLEVFQMSDDPIVRNPIEIRQSMSTPGDNDRRSFTFPTSPKTRITKDDDDVVSDASSDLFEIESFSTQTTSQPMYRRRDSLDEIPSYNERRFIGHGRGILHSRRSLDETIRIPSQCYEPSEASINWSISTAEGFNRVSVSTLAASEYKDIRFTKPDSEKLPTNGVNGGSKRKGNGFFNCGCGKVVKCTSEQCCGGARLALETGRSRADIGSMHLTRTSSKPPLARSRSYSARMSNALTTH